MSYPLVYISIFNECTIKSIIQFFLRAKKIEKKSRNFWLREIEKFKKNHSVELYNNREILAPEQKIEKSRNFIIKNQRIKRAISRNFQELKSY